MPANVVAADTFLMTEEGPTLAPALESGVDRVWTVDRNGAFALSLLTHVRVAGAVAAWRLLTEAGDVVLPSGALALTSAGPLDGREVEAALRKRQVVRLDIVSPEDLPAAKGGDVSPTTLYRSCLAALPGGIIQLPRRNGTADQILPRVMNILQMAEVRYRTEFDDRWAAIVLEPLKDADGGVRGGWEIQADVLAALTAWAGHSQDYESRLRLRDYALRRRLLAAVAGAGRPFSVRWLPGYSPVESRVRTGPGRSWPARVAVLAAFPLTATTLCLRTESAGDLIVSLAVLRPA